MLTRSRYLMIVLVFTVGGLLGGCPGMLPEDGADTGDGDETPTTGNTGLTGKYAGSSICMRCHSTAHSNWTATLHAEAFDTLEEIGQETNAACVGCHVVGFGEEGGFVDRATTNDLAGVGCEACHGPAAAHIANVTDDSVVPSSSIASSVCGKCHTGDHHPHIGEWQQSGHAKVESHVAEDMIAGNAFYVESCGVCHSADVYALGVIEGREVPATLLEGKEVAELATATCVTCHDPHKRTNNAVAPDEGRDFQLRFPESVVLTPNNTVSATQDTTRFNQCGQCHHGRGRTWQATSRGPHHSVQSNVYAGEMAMPEGESPLVFSRVSVHSFTTEQCATCHMFRQDFESEVAPAISGHTFEVNRRSCATSGCHPSEAQALSAQSTLQAEIQQRLERVAGLLGDASTWQYSAEGGPTDQSGLSDNVKKARFLYSYVISDGSLGMHNPDYIRDMLIEAEQLLSD